MTTTLNAVMRVASGTVASSAFSQIVVTDVALMGGLPAAAAAETATARTVEDLLLLASRNETEMQHHVAQAFQYHERAIAIDPVTDTKGDGRQQLINAAESHNANARALRFRAMPHRAEAEHMQDRRPGNS